MEGQEPRVISLSSAQGAGEATVQYGGRFLYSKYNPQKSVLAAVQALNLLPGALVLVFSPCLFYGWNELKEKCGAAGAEILCVEAEKGLHALAKKTIAEKNLDARLLDAEETNAKGLDDFLSASPKKFRRILRIDFSAGVFFNAAFYQNFFECAQNIVAAFWKNRLTLVRLGRLYGKNIFKNLPAASRAIPFESLERTLSKPILVCGAGESLDELTRAAADENRLQGEDCLQGQNLAVEEERLKNKNAAPCPADKNCPQGQNLAAAINERFFVVAVDASLLPLLEAGIKVDAAVAAESQLAIERAYIGLAAARNCAANGNRLQGQNLAADEERSQDKNAAPCPADKNCPQNKERSQSQKRAADKKLSQDKNRAAGGDCSRGQSEPLFFFDLTSREGIARRFSRKSYYISEFDKNRFLSRLDKAGVLPSAAPPLGSVGLEAAYLALRLRRDDSVPVYVLGLDFCFSAGKTHAAGTAQSKETLLRSSRLNPAGNFYAAFGAGSESVRTKNGKMARSQKNLLAYAALFRQFFAGAKNVFDAAAFGTSLGLEQTRLFCGAKIQGQAAEIENSSEKKRADIKSGGPSGQTFGGQDGGPPIWVRSERDGGKPGQARFVQDKDETASAGALGKESARIQKCRRFLEEELCSLRELADLLSNGEGSRFRNRAEALEGQIMKMLEGKEYLFLHFPDGTEPRPRLDFLARVRSQIDFFSKDIETALAHF